MFCRVSCPIVYRSTAIAWLCATVACGDGLVDGDYLGEPLYTLRGNVVLNDIDPDGHLPEGELRVALVWTSGEPSLENPDFFDPIEQQTVATAHFPAQYELSLYAPPGRQALETYPTIAGGSVAFGALLVYIDTNGDQQWTGDGVLHDPLVGGAYDRVLAYAPEPVESTAFDGALSAGHHVLQPASSAPCATPVAGSTMRLASVDDRRVDLQLGIDYERLFLDVDCDADTHEWCAWCPALDSVLSQIELLCAGIEPDRAYRTSSDAVESKDRAVVPWLLERCDELRRCLECGPLETESAVEAPVSR